jgi:hypothetical protein
VDHTANWKPDPFGLHELRFFSADGKPTRLVMDAGRTSFDKPPTDRGDGSPPAEFPEGSPIGGPVVVPPIAEPPASDPSQSDAPESTAAPPETSTWAVAPPEAVPVEGSEDRSTMASDIEPSLATRESEAQLAPHASSDPTHGVANRQVQGAVAVLPMMNPFAPGAWDPPAPAIEMPAESMSRALKITYLVVTGVLALSALSLLLVHLHHSNGGASRQAVATTTLAHTTSTTTSTTSPTPTTLSSTAAAATAALVSDWSTNNRAAALTVATPTAVASLFASPYVSGKAIDRGCSTAPPIVCTYGPPGGASPTDAIYEIKTVQAPGGWYVGSVAVEN